MTAPLSPANTSQVRGLAMTSGQYRRALAPSLLLTRVLGVEPSVSLSEVRDVVRNEKSAHSRGHDKWRTACFNTPSEWLTAPSWERNDGWLSSIKPMPIRSANMNLVKSKLHGLRSGINSLDRKISSSPFGHVFKLEGSGHPKEIPGSSVLAEIRAGATTFATMAYIIAVNATVISQTGGPCPCDLDDRTQCDSISSYVDCKEVLTGLSPGMGLNAYFAFQVVGYNGSGRIPYGVALTAVFVEGLIFMFLALTGMRQWLVKLIPATIKTATGVGIGLFLTEIGLSYSAGLGVITGGWKATPLTIAGCPAEMINADTQIRNTSISYFPHTDEGDARFDFFKDVVSLHPIKHTLNALDWSITQNGSQFALALFTFLYVDIIDATATLYSMVGCMMVRQITQVNWRYIGDALPSFVVMAFIPFSYSVAYGLIAGLFLYTMINGLIALTVWATGARLEPQEYDMKEYWTWRGFGKQPWSFSSSVPMDSLNYKNDATSVTVPVPAVTPHSIH
ncbi:hypothetical protein G7Z17_g5914 [Cylindrodendrum hubeiense]|uniref:Uncharacterized protein n=1 Tax=Cylindrodendrum hubeiense TaxID=595255 RepID=A0A9P5HA11_9HYPO|nr:hypothetical protein G7Z17_g5914 [Cylindrodendrum hubeiense]